METKWMLRKGEAKQASEIPGCGCHGTMALSSVWPHPQSVTSPPLLFSPHLSLLLFHHQTSTGEERSFLNSLPHPEPVQLHSSNLCSQVLLFKKPCAPYATLHLCKLWCTKFSYSWFPLLLSKFHSASKKKKKWRHEEAVACSRPQSYFTISWGLQPVLLS